LQRYCLFLNWQAFLQLFFKKILSAHTHLALSTTTPTS
jgi:hypothetical protein